MVWSEREIVCAIGNWPDGSEKEYDTTDRRRRIERYRSNTLRVRCGRLTSTNIDDVLFTQKLETERWGDHRSDWHRQSQVRWHRQSQVRKRGTASRRHNRVARCTLPIAATIFFLVAQIVTSRWGLTSTTPFRISTTRMSTISIIEGKFFRVIEREDDGWRLGFVG
jgi:hypothetical protein